MEKQSTLNCSGMLTDILLEGVREMIGTARKISKNEIESHSEKSVTAIEKFTQIETYQQEELLSLIEDAPNLYGSRGSSGIALRIGEASFRSFLRSQGDKYLLTDLSYRLMGSQRRIVFGLNQLAKFAHQNCGAKIEISDDERNWYWNVIIDQSIPKWNQLYSPYMMGLLREFFLWTSGGRYYQMEELMDETDKISFFQIAIKKQPLGN
jgi:hypothetical protein